MAITDADPNLQLMAYTVEQASSVLGLDKARVGSLIRAGVLPHIKLGARWLIGKRALEEWLTAQCLANAQVPLGGQNTTVSLEARKYTRRNAVQREERVSNESSSDQVGRDRHRANGVVAAHSSSRVSRPQVGLNGR